MRRFLFHDSAWPLLAVLALWLGGTYALAATVPRVTGPVRALMTAAIPVPHARWLAQCSALPVDAVDGITVERVRVRPGRVTAALRKGTRRGWLTAHRLGTYAGAGVWAVRGPTALRDRMAASPTCSRVVAWSAVSTLPAVARAWIAERSTCCGSATLAGRTFTSWPCAWQLAASEGFRPGLAVDELVGYGPGVVGQRGACAEYTEPVTE